MLLTAWLPRTPISPTSGQHNTEITIGGTLLCGAGDNVVKVTLTGVEATIVDKADVSELSVSVVAQPSSAVAGDVVLTSSTGSAFTAEDAFDTIVSESETFKETESGGTRVVIEGERMLGGACWR